MMNNQNWTRITNGSTIILIPRHKPCASIIWLHGLGANAEDLTGLPQQLNAKSIRHVFPNAPIRPVTFAQGMPLNAWFDIIDLSLNSKQDENGIREANKIIEELIANEIVTGIPSHKIILAGFSQGGAMALYAGLRYQKPLAGIIALSSFLPLHDKLACEKSQENETIPILLTHGSYDPLIPLQSSDFFRSCLINLGYKVKLNIYNMAHEICSAEITDMSRWISDVLPIEA